MLNLFRRRRLDSTHLALLSLFLEARPLDNEQFKAMWSQALREPYDKAIRRFWDRGYLQQATPLEAARRCTTVELKDALRQANLKVTGRKDELIARLAEGAPDLLARLALQHPVPVCSPLGREAVQSWVEADKRLRDKTDTEVEAAVRAGKPERAARAIADYRRSLPPPMRGVLGVGASSPDEARCEGVSELLTMAPPVSADTADFAEYRVRASIEWLWGRRLPGPDEYRRLGYRAVFGVIARKNLEQYRRNSDVVRGVIISATDDACDSCKALAAAGPYTFDNVPIIPNPDCSRDWCRCCYSPWVKSWSELGIEGMPERKSLARR